MIYGALNVYGVNKKRKFKINHFLRLLHETVVDGDDGVL